MRSASISPASERRAHHVEMRGDRIQHADRRGARVAHRATASIPDGVTKLKVMTSCQSRCDERALDGDRAAAWPRESGSMRWTCAARRRGNGVVAVDPRDFLDEVFLDREVEAVRRRRHDEVVAVARERRSRGA